MKVNDVSTSFAAVRITVSVRSSLAGPLRLVVPCTGEAHIPVTRQGRMMSTKHNPITVEQQRWGSLQGWDASLKVPSATAAMSASTVMGDKMARLRINIWPYAALTDVHINDQEHDGDELRSIELTTRAGHENHSTEITLVLTVADALMLRDALIAVDAAEAV